MERLPEIIIPRIVTTKSGINQFNRLLFVEWEFDPPKDLVLVDKPNSILADRERDIIEK